MFGATGSGCMVKDNQAIAGQFSPFWWGEYTTNKWAWNNMSFLPKNADRFVVDGTIVPEPDGLSLLITAAVALLAFAWRRHRLRLAAGIAAIALLPPAIGRSTWRVCPLVLSTIVLGSEPSPWGP